MTASVSPFIAGTRTHRFWWTWVPALPLSRNDKWYRILKVTFADQTTNCLKAGLWRGFYTENTEYHQTVSVFQTFSALPTLWWLEQLLLLCDVEFLPPLRSARWQYELQSKYVDSKQESHADLALRIVDGRGPDEEFVVIFEAKKKAGGFKAKDLADPDHYARLRVFRPFKRLHSLLLIDEQDARRVTASKAKLVTWQDLARLQLNAFESLDLTDPSKKILVTLLRQHLSNFSLLPRLSGASLDYAEVAEASLQCPDPRLSVLIRGAQTCIMAHRGLDVQPPLAWLADEHDITAFPSLKLLNGCWFDPVW